jgi:hypothetical protein
MVLRGLSFVVASLLIAAPVAAWAGPASGNPAVGNSSKHDAAAFIVKYGNPDIDDTNIDSNPHPTVVSRWLVYKQENVHAFFLPGGIFGAKPPYGPWKLLTLQDERTSQTLTPDEVEERMLDRTAKAQAK